MRKYNLADMYRSDVYIVTGLMKLGEKLNNDVKFNMVKNMLGLESLAALSVLPLVRESLRAR